MRADESIVRNAADARQVNDAKKKVRRVRREGLDDLRVVLSTPHGQRLIWKMIVAGGVFEEVFSTDTIWTAYQQGRRVSAMELFNDVREASPAALLDMMKALMPATEQAAEDTGTKEDADV